MLEHITAPAPRMLLRLLKVRHLLEKLLLEEGPIEHVAEIGPGLGDATSLALHIIKPERIDVFEDSTAAIDLLKIRFKENSIVNTHTAFETTTVNYQLVLCFEVIEHIEDDRSFIRQIAQSMDTDGWLIGSVPAYMKKWQDIDILAGHYRRYEKQEIIDKLSEQGMCNISVETYGFPLINLLYPLRKLYYSSLLKSSRTNSKQEATAKSGVSRGLAMKFNKNVVFSIVRFFSVFQSLPYFSDFGDGFVFKCQMK